MVRISISLTGIGDDFYKIIKEVSPSESNKIVSSLLNKALYNMPLDGVLELYLNNREIKLVKSRAKKIGIVSEEKKKNKISNNKKISLEQEDDINDEIKEIVSQPASDWD